MRHFVDQQMWNFKSRLSLIVRANVVLNRTVVVDSDLYLCLFCSRISTILLTYVQFFRQILMRQLAHRSRVDWLLNWQKNLQVISSFIFKQIMLYKSFTSNKEINSTHSKRAGWLEKAMGKLTNESNSLHFKFLWIIYSPATFKDI